AAGLPAPTVDGQPDACLHAPSPRCPAADLYLPSAADVRVTPTSDFGQEATGLRGSPQPRKRSPKSLDAAQQSQTRNLYSMPGRRSTSGGKLSRFSAK